MKSIVGNRRHPVLDHMWHNYRPQILVAANANVGSDIMGRSIFIRRDRLLAFFGVQK